MNEWEWNCPNCGKANLDDFNLTASPYCEGCNHEFVWDELLTAKQMEQANEKLASESQTARYQTQ